MKYIGYTPIPVRAADRYPLVRMPAADRPVPVKFPRAGRVGQRGYCEAAFVECLRRYFPKPGPVRVFDDRHLPVREAVRPYEPDVALLNERSGLNLFLNIEVDEPYDAVYRTPTHYQGADLGRDLFFTRRGWVVLRFAEIQVHQHPEACCAVVAQLLARLDPAYQVPAELQRLAPPPAVPVWSLLQAQQWARVRYREQYLGIEQFGRYAEEEAASLATETLPVEVELEKLVEQAIPPPPLPRPGPLQRTNPDPRRKILRFDADKHEYTIHGRPATAVSTLVKEFFPEYDTPYWSARKAFERGCTAEEVAVEWAAKALASSTAGTALHLLIEEFYNHGRATSTSPEFAHFLDFHRQHPHLVPYRTEWQVFHEELMLAGTIDFVARNDDGSLSIFDWKRSHRVVNAAGQPQLNAYQPAEGPLQDLPECAFSHYTLQQNVYKWLLEAKYGCRVRDMHLVVLHPDYDRFHLVPVPERPTHVAHMLAAIRHRR